MSNTEKPKIDIGFVERVMDANFPQEKVFGHVTLVEGYSLPAYVGCHALVKLRDKPGQTVAVITNEHRLQTLLESALLSGYLIWFRGRLLQNPPAPGGGQWAVDVYAVDEVILYNTP